MADVPVTNPTTGEIRMVPEEGVKAFTEQTGWHVSTAEQRQVGAENLESGSVGQQAIAAGEQAVRTGTFGIAPGLEGWEQREKVLRRESPVVSMAAQGVGAIAPALVTGGIAGGVAGGLGLGARGVGAASMVAEGLAGGLADEIEQARYETRDVSAGNVFLFGLGGELVGRALPHALSLGAGKIKRALTATEAATGDGLPNVLVAAEERSVASQAKLAREMPAGSPERLQALRDTAPQQYERMATDGAERLDRIADMTGKMGDTSSSKQVVGRLRETIADESPAQVEFFTGLKGQLSQVRDDIGAPIERTRPPTLDEYLGSVKSEAAKTKALDEVTDEVLSRAKKRGLEKADGAEWLPEQADELAKIQTEVLGDWAPKPKGLRESPGLQGFSKRVDQVIDTTLRRLDKTTDTVEQYLIARDAKKQLQHVSKKMSLVKGPQDAVLHDEFRGLVDDAWRGVNEGLKDRSLFGAAADIEADINGAWHEKVLRGIGVTEGDLARKVDVDFRTGRTIAEYDPSKVRSFLKGDAVDRKITQGKLEQMLEGAEEMAAAHERHGTWNPDEIKALRDDVARMREDLGLADELNVAKNTEAPKAPKYEASLKEQVLEAAKGYAVNRAAGAVGAGIGTLVGGPMGTVLGWGAGEAIQRMGKRLVQIDRAARAATKETARNLAGVGVGYAARAEGKVAARAEKAATEGLRWTQTAPSESVDDFLARQSKTRADAPPVSSSVQRSTGKTQDQPATRAAWDKQFAQSGSERARAIIDRIRSRRSQEGSVALAPARAAKKKGPAPKYFEEKLTGPLGRTEGGFYRGSDGKERYVKFLSGDLAKNEAANAAVYRDFGLNAPEFEIVTGAKVPGRAGKVDALVSERLGTDWQQIPRAAADGKVTPEAAAEFVEGVPADIVIGNWDVGINGGNIMTDGKRVVRIDSGEAGPNVGDPDAPKMWRQFVDAVHASKETVRTPNDVVSSVLKPEKLAAVKSHLENGIKNIESAVQRAGGMDTYVRSRFEHLPPAQTAQLARKMASRLAFVKQNVEAIAGYASVGHGLFDILTSPIGLTSIVGGGAVVAYPAIQNLESKRRSSEPVTALSRFQGDYSSPEASFDAKRKVLDQDQIAPEVLYETLANSLGDLPKANPELFQAIAARTSQKIRFVRENLPPGLSASLLYPNGTPPSHSDLRDFALLWNTVMDPETVLHDLNQGTAVPQQMQFLKQNDPDLFEQLRSDMIEQVGTHFRDVPTSTKVQLDLLLDADGLAGPIFSRDAARFIGDAQKKQAEEGQRPASPGQAGANPAAAAPAGLSAIRTSVTNRAA